jgi:hypothetical protein
LNPVPKCIAIGSDTLKSGDVGYYREAIFPPEEFDKEL